MNEDTAAKWFISSVIVEHGFQMDTHEFSVKNGYKIERHKPMGEGDYHAVIVSDKNFKTEYFNIIQINYLPAEDGYLDILSKPHPELYKDQ